MSTAYNYSEQTARPELRNGDSMKQEEFHRIYEQMPEDFKAELIDGTVFVAMPLGRPHATGHARLTSVFDAYSARTRGVEVLLDATTILGTDDEVQPDLQLRILHLHNGQYVGFVPRLSRYGKAYRTHISVVVGRWTGRTLELLQNAGVTLSVLFLGTDADGKGLVEDKPIAPKSVLNHWQSLRVSYVLTLELRNNATCRFAIKGFWYPDSWLYVFLRPHGRCFQHNPPHDVKTNRTQQVTALQ